MSTLIDIPPPELARINVRFCPKADVSKLSGIPSKADTRKDYLFGLIGCFIRMPFFPIKKSRAPSLRTMAVKAIYSMAKV